MENNKDQERRLKIQSKYTPHTFGEAKFPEIRLTGKWLENFGFTCGHFVTSAQRDSAIIITMLSEVKKQQAAEKRNQKNHRLYRLKLRISLAINFFVLNHTRKTTHTCYEWSDH